MSVDEMAASGVCDELKEAQHKREDGGKAVPTFVAKVIELSQDVLKTKLKNAKLGNRIAD